MVLMDDNEMHAVIWRWSCCGGDGGEWVNQLLSFDVHQEVEMLQEDCSDDCFRNVLDVEGPFEGTLETEIQLQGAPCVDTYLGPLAA